MPPLRRESLADQAADQLLDRIRSGEWPLESKLPGETTLAAQLGVGRSTVREAIRRLAGNGVLTTRQGAGVFVAALDTPSGLRTMVDGAEITAVIEARIAIETEAAGLAAERRGDDDLAAMDAALVARGGDTADLVRHVHADTEFHRAVVVAARSPLLLEMFDGFAARTERAMADMLRRRGGDTGAGYGDAEDQDAHRAVLTAIRAGEPETARRLTRSHLSGLLDSAR
jgi:DNA-binding FadR family transcriptional regulator